MKRLGLSALVLVAAVSFGFVGCGGKEPAKGGTAAADMVKYKCEKCQKGGEAKKADAAPQC